MSAAFGSDHLVECAAESGEMDIFHQLLTTPSLIECVHGVHGLRLRGSVETLEYMWLSGF